MRKMILGVSLLLLLLPGMLLAQAKVGTAGAQFLEIGVSARDRHGGSVCGGVE
ncbi:MAG: hypothetical protein IPH59_16870 [bacterium]|nr:hypothetical protein [bacterium]